MSRLDVQVIGNSDAYREGCERIWGKDWYEVPVDTPDIAEAIEDCIDEFIPQSPFEALFSAIYPDVRFVRDKPSSSKS